MSSDVKSLAEKLTDVRQAVSGIAKGGHNDHHDYDYVRAEDVLRSVREAMNQARVGLFTEALDISHFTETGGKSFARKYGVDLVTHALRLAANSPDPKIRASVIHSR